MNERTLIGLLLIGLAFGACDDEGFRTQTSNDILVEPTDIVFKRVILGQTDIREVTVRQGGEATDELTISKVYIKGYEDCDFVQHNVQPGGFLPGELNETCEFAIQERPELPLVLSHGQFRNLLVMYRPQNAEAPEATALVIESDNLDKPTVEVRLDLIAAQPRISTDESFISFQPGVPDQSAILLVKNSGSGPLRVADIDLRMGTDAPESGPEFEFRAEADLPWIIEEGRSQNLEVRYNPVDDIDDSAELILKSNDPSTPEFIIQLSSLPAVALIELQPNPVEFGTDLVQAVTKELTVYNRGFRRLSVLDMRIDPPNEDFEVLGQPSFQVFAGAERAIQVRYKPSTGAGSDAELLVISNAANGSGDNPEQTEYRVPLVRNVMTLPATLAVEPLAIDFSEVETGSAATQTVTLANSGGRALDITRIALSTSDDAAAIDEVAFATDDVFSIGSGGGTASLEPGDDHTVEIEFARAAGDRNQYLGYLVIESNASGSPHVVTLSSFPPPMQ